MSKDKDYYLEIEDREEDEKFTLPSEDINQNENFPFKNSKHSENNLKKYKKKSKKIKWIVIITLLIILYLSYNTILFFFLELIKQNPTFYKYYLYLESQIVNKTIIGLTLLAALGSLFFLALPSEALFIYFLNSTDYFPVLIIILMVFGNVIGLIFNYIFGWVLGEKILRWMFKKNFEKYKMQTEKYGGIIIFFGNILPGPIEVLSIFYGGFKFNFKRYIFLSFMGRLTKYVILFIAYLYFWDQLIGYYDSFINFFKVLF